MKMAFKSLDLAVRRLLIILVRSVSQESRRQMVGEEKTWKSWFH